MYAENKHWNGPETAEIISYLTGKGFAQTEETERYYTFEDENGNEFYFDFDPWMHIGPEDDEICYDRPVYGYFRNFCYLDNTYCVTDIQDIEYRLSWVKDRFYPDDEEETAA